MNTEDKPVVVTTPEYPDAHRASKSDYLELTIEDVAIDTVIDIRDYLKQNAIPQKRTMYAHELFRWLIKNL